LLKHIPKELSPALVKVLMEMGHGDEIVLADGNFPSASLANKLIRCDGLDIPTLLSGILTLFPLDTYCNSPVTLMEVVEGDRYVPTIWNEYRNIVAQHHDIDINFQFIDRFDFYEKSKQCYAIAATSEQSLYANIILKKGVVKY